MMKSHLRSDFSWIGQVDKIPHAPALKIQHVIPCNFIHYVCVNKPHQMIGTIGQEKTSVTI